jgi:hypothetical protein
MYPPKSGKRRKASIGGLMSAETTTAMNPGSSNDYCHESGSSEEIRMETGMESHRMPRHREMRTGRHTEAVQDRAR